MAQIGSNVTSLKSPQYSDYIKENFWTSIREFLIDFLGSLIPGVLFSFFAIVTIVWGVGLITQLISVNPLTLFANTELLFSNSRVELFLIFFLVSFILGSVFFRKDVKEPDQFSATYIWKKRKENALIGETAVGKVKKETSSEHTNESIPQKIRNHISHVIHTPVHWMEKKLNIQEEVKIDTQFPYPFLYDYLKQRGLMHLAGLIPWRGTNNKSLERRSKMFLNVLKIRLQYLVPDKCSEMIKHEAHVRMMSSLWYACKLLKTLQYGFIIIVCLVGVTVYINQASIVRSYYNDIIAFFSWSIFSLLLTYMIKDSIKKFFHYQRVREIIQILETAYMVSRKDPSIFDGIIPGRHTRNAGVQGKSQKSKKRI